MEGQIQQTAMHHVQQVYAILNASRSETYLDSAENIAAAALCGIRIRGDDFPGSIGHLSVQQARWYI